MIAQLIPTDGTKPVTLYRDITVVGRDGDICDLTIPHKSVSKLHSVLVKSDGLLFVRDLGSTNGTKVNGQKITRGALLPGDVIAFAGAKFKIFLGPGEAEPPEGPLTESIPSTSSKKISVEKSKKSKKAEVPSNEAKAEKSAKSSRSSPIGSSPIKSASGKPDKDMSESNSDVRLLNEDELAEID